MKHYQRVILYNIVEIWLKSFKGRPNSFNICNLVDHIVDKVEEFKERS